MKNKIIIVFVWIISITVTSAQTGGPGQPEFMQFQQSGTANLVNPSTGTFSYQIHLFTIGGYPMNLTYQAGIQMEDVASMVGLGWNFNAGCVVRTLRGMPDDFNGDIITKKFSVKPNETYGGKLGVDLEIAGLPENVGVNVGAGLGVFYNNYKGWGLEPSLSGSLGYSHKMGEGVGGSASLGMGISVNSQSGVDKYLSPSIGLKLGSGNDKLGISLGKTWSVNSNEGLKTSMNIGLSFVRFSDVKRKGIMPDGKTKKDKSETDQSSMSLLGYASNSYLNNSFQPDIDYPFENTSGTYSGAVGFDGFYVDPNIRVTGYFSKQKLASTTQNFAAYGSMYESASIGGNSLMDFNTEKKLPYFIGESKILPIPYKTPDVFNLNAQGLSMTFSVNKNDIGVVGDADGSITSNGNQAGVELNFGQLFKVGANFGTTNSYQQTGKWNPTHIKFKPDQEIINNSLYQQFNFKNHGEINKFDYSEFSLLGNYDPVQFNLLDESHITNQLSNGNHINNNVFNSNQPVRQSTINYLNAAEADKIGFDKQITCYNFRNTSDSLISRISDYRKSNHLSEISVIQPDGMKYVFGIPVYNITQKEVSFNVSGNMGVDVARNLIQYVHDQDNSTGNLRGIDHFFESTITPAYATQFLITAVLSPDYRDLTNNGITDDDLGNYVKFSYYKEDFVFKWRTPFAQDMATYNKGLRSDSEDDKGSYVYGEKELWYVRSIESKTEISEFFYGKRNDGHGVTDENGGMNKDLFLRKLDSIVVYSLQDRKKNGNNAIPIKTIHFDYDYSLCPKTENVTGNPNTGKLTLHKVDFTYERSRKGKLTPYVFGYGNITDTKRINPEYNSRSVNRWGYYQKNNIDHYSDLENSPLSNIDYPYSSQEKAMMDSNAYAWNLTNIIIPGGGQLKVNYEAHDYAYIQNKTAGQMFKVTGLSAPFFPDMSANKLHNLIDPSDPTSTLGIVNKIYFKLTNYIGNTDPVRARKELEENYIKDIKDGYLYYKFYVNLKDGNSEYVTGYTKVKDYGVSNDPQYGYIELEPVKIDDENSMIKCNPILKTAFQFLRINRNSLLFSNSTMNTPATFGSFIHSLPSIFSQLGAQIAASTMGVNLYCESKGYCQYIDLAKSFIRLYNPQKMKIAGGSRVKQISIDDNWDDVTGNTHEGKAYTTTYAYTTEEISPVTNAKVTISSGVADYEPMVGGDEISLKQPIFYSDRKILAPDNDYYVEDPVNESLFPAPQITYGKVTQITNGSDSSVGKTGKIINEFFTAKDYPVKVNRTTIDVKRDKTDFNTIQMPFVAIDQQHDFASVSQGYSIELNNMSGLPKATWVYNEKGDRISGEQSEYFPSNDHFILIDRHGQIKKNQALGLSVEYTINGKKSYDQSVSNSYNANLNASFTPFLIPLVMPLYSQMTDEKQFQSIVMNKVIHRNALLKSKTVYEQSSSITTENLAFDEITGEAILTKLANEFNDTLFSFKYPAWWMYDGMGPAYPNAKLNLTAANEQNLKVILKSGDELRSLYDGARLWVQNPTVPTFVNDIGLQQSHIGSHDYQVYAPVAKNLLSSSAGQVVTWKLNPLRNQIKIDFGTLNTLNSSAIQYYDNAVMYCDSCGVLLNRLGKNDFLSGKRGNFKPKQTWFFLEDRTPANIVNGITNIKQEGLFKTYNDFWKVPVNASVSWSPIFTHWEWKEKVNLTDVDGQTIETEDRLGRKTANVFGYKNTLITAQAVNAAYGEVYFDGFEDYYCAYCPYKPGQISPQVNANNNLAMKRVKITNGNLSISNAEAHTGKYSLEVPASLTFTISPPVNCKDSDRPTDKACKECVGGFSPAINNKYVFSCWVKVNSPPPILSCNDASVIITSPGSSPVTLHPEGPVIENWQRVTGNFTTSSNNNISVNLKKGSALTFFDDIRIFPADGNMVSYVYDDVNLRLTYSLDENNYFTKNEYNNQGELMRVKKETEKGIITIKESSSSLKKNGTNGNQ
ncbi:MAG: hypothetical protein V4539_22905 [Bacteroidota bacterium]